MPPVSTAIAIGGGPTAYAGSLADGDIVEVDLRTGEVTTLVDTDGGRPWAWTCPAGVPDRLGRTAATA